MAYEGYLTYDGVEIANHGRLALLARAMGVDTVRVSEATAAALLTRMDETQAEWSQIADAPWYDAGYPASAEFAGVLVLAMQGLDDSSLSASVVEYITDGGNAGRARTATQAIVGNVIFVGSTERGVEYGQRWLNRVLTKTRHGKACSGSDLHYLRTLGSTPATAEMVHRRDVSLTRAFSITRKKRSACSASQGVTFTLTDTDGYEYGEPVQKITALGGVNATGPGVTSSGTLTAQEIICPRYDYTPIYDPLYPALVASPQAPDFYPAGWTIKPGDTFQRSWARITPTEPSELGLVPFIRLSSTQEARMVRVSIWPADSANNDQCDPLFSVMVSYLLPDLGFYIDGEARAAYVWDGASPVVRRADSLVYAPDAKPVQWTSFNDAAGLLVTLDVFAVPAESGGGYQGGGNVRASLALVPKSD